DCHCGKPVPWYTGTPVAWRTGETRRTRVAPSTYGPEEVMSMAVLPRLTRDPTLADFVGISNRLGRLLNDGLLGAEWQSPDGATTAWVPPVDIFEEDHAIRIMARSEERRVGKGGRV